MAKRAIEEYKEMQRHFTLRESDEEIDNSVEESEDLEEDEE